MLRFDLEKIIKRLRPSQSRDIILRDITPTGTHRRQLERINLTVVRAWTTACQTRVMPQYQTELNRLRLAEQGAVMDDTSSLTDTFKLIAEEVDRLIIELSPQVRNWVVAVEKWHREKWTANMTPTGVKLDTLIGPEDVAETMETIVQRNVSLIRSISSEARSRTEGIVFRGFTNRTPTREIAREISLSLNMSRQRALRIASDQTVKLSSDLDTERMRQAGIDEWEWVHSGKLHYRKEHKRRNGKRYTFDNPPADMPGQLPYCGCKKKAVVTFD